MSHSYEIKLTEMQHAVLANLARLMDKEPEDVITIYVDLIMAQALPIYHLTNFLISSGEIMPSFHRAVEASKDPAVNLGEILSSLLKEIYEGNTVANRLEEINNYFADRAEDLETSSPETRGPLPDGKLDIHKLIEDIKREKKAQDEDS